MMIDGSITPAAGDGEPHPQGRVIGLDQLGDTQLQPGDIITGIGSARSFNAFEQGIVARVAPGAEPSRNNIISRRPLEAELRPKGFNGEFRNGTASVLPNDRSAILDLKSRQGMILEPAAVLRLVLVADMYSSGRGIRGHVVREATYYRTGSTFDVFGKTVRVLGSSDRLKKAEPVAAALNLEAIERARAVSRYALQHTMRGGLPGHGKRR